MSITDELRKWAARELASWKMARERFDALTAIADRIDAEHESKVAEVASGGDYWESTHIELPKDADNVPVSIGDRMEWVRYKDDDPTIVRTVSGIGNGVFFAWSDEQGRYAQYEAHAYRHHHAPTVEDVLREFTEKVIDSQIPSVHPTYEEAIAEYSAKLRLAGEDE